MLLGTCDRQKPLFKFNIYGLVSGLYRQRVIGEQYKILRVTVPASAKMQNRIHNLFFFEFEF